LSHPFPSRSFRPREPLYKRNGKIRAREVRVLDENKQQLGIMTLNEALRTAQAKGLDLVEVVPQATPPVCRIVDYGKLLYEESKRESHSRPAAGQMKELQVSAVIGAHDLATKRNHAIKFLCDDMKVRIKLRFRGRQKAHKEIGFQVVNQLVEAVAAYGRPDAPAKMLGDRDIHVTISPLPRNKRAKNPHEGEPDEPDEVEETDEVEEAEPKKGSAATPAEPVDDAADKRPPQSDPAPSE
jgi:translation initiation factor IF-3